MIRKATRSDVPAMVGMARDFHNASPLASLAFSEKAAAAACMAAVDGGNNLAIILDLNGPRGALVAHLTTYPLGDALLAKEDVFWIKPEARGPWAIKLIRAYEQWAHDRGASMVGMSCFADGRTQKLFASAGFTPAEVNSIKAI